MILFKPEHVEVILEGRKTQTRRLGKKRWNVDAIHQCKTKLFGVEPFAHVRILEVHQELLVDISEDDARAEGYPNRVSYLASFMLINGMLSIPSDLHVWVVTFELAAIPKGES